MKTINNGLYVACYSSMPAQSHHHHHLFLKRPFFHAKLGLDVCPKSSPSTSLKTAHSGCKPSSFMSSLTHCSHVFLLRPRLLVPSTTNPLQADTQSSTLLGSRCPNHLNLPRLTTSAAQLKPRRLHKSSLRFLSFKDTPHIHLTIIRSVLSRLLRSSAFIAHVSVPYIKTLWTQAL